MVELYDRLFFHCVWMPVVKEIYPFILIQIFLYYIHRSYLLRSEDCEPIADTDFVRRLVFSSREISRKGADHH